MEVLLLAGWFLGFNALGFGVVGCKILGMFCSCLWVLRFGVSGTTRGLSEKSPTWNRAETLF